MAETPRGGIRKETSVIVLELDSGDHIIVVSLSTRNDTQIIGVDPTTGALCFTGTQGLDVFASESDAGRYLKSRGMPSRPPIRAKAILGYAALGSMGLLLVATRVKASIPELPGGDTVYTVMESQWIKIPLSNSQFQSKFEAKNAADLTDIYIDTLHFYCETRDITRHFPSSEPVDNPDREFVWNLWLSAPFRKLGLQNHCVVLLQGFAEVRTFTEARDLPVTVAVTARRSRLHPGTRYLARGLNATFSTGNEVECEQLVWPARVTPGRPHPFSTYLWRRGTVPIWWGAEIKSTVAEAEIYVAETEPYLGSGKYYRRLARRYRNTLGKGGGKESDDQSSNPLIVCVNLLRNAAGKPETVLALRFEEAVNYVNSRNEVPDAKLCLMDYDWHAETKAIGEPSTVNGLWERLKTPTIAIGFGMGEYHPVPSDKSSSAVIPNKGSQGGYYTLSSKQDGVIRFNCADSLDRTNAASFFGAVQVLAEQCRRLGLPLDSSKYNTPSVLPNGRAGERDRDSSRGALGPLPPGWEMRSDAVTGQVFYIDHNTKTTTWNHPCPDEPWRRFVMTVEEFRDATLPSPIAAMAELFLIAGDIHATLYTGSKAMHSHIINIFSEEVGKGKRSAATNMAITLQRRFRNVLMDSTRQKQLEMFLGYRLYKYFPTLPGRPLQVLTRPQACLLNPIPNMFTSPNSPSFLLSNNFRDTAWICPAGGDSVQLLIYLAEPSHVCQILLTVAHGADDSTSPGSFDVSTGRTLKDIKLVLEGSKVPKCAHGTLLTYPLPGAMDPEEVAITGAGAGEQAYSWLYDFEEQEGEIDFLTRLVEIKFYPAAPGAPMTLGQVEVVGASLLWSSVLRDRDLPLIKASPSPKPPHLSEQTRSVTLPNIDLLSLESTSMTSSSFIDPAPMMTRTYSTPNTAACQVFDLLTGEFITEKPFPEQGSELSTFKNSNGRNNSESSQKSRNPESWNPFVTNSPATSVTNLPTSVRKSPEPSRPPSQAHPDAEVYLDLLKAVCGKIPSKSITFQEAMELEVARLLLGISAYGRDRALVSVGRDPATIDPNRLISTGAMAQVKQAASQLATIAEIDTEDKDLSSLGFDERRSEPDEVMENLHCLRIGCLSDMCQVTYAKGSGTFQYFEAVAKSSSFLGTCALCKRRVCAACHAGKGSALLYHNGPNPAGLGVGGNPKPARGPTAVDAIICKNCCPSSVRDYILLERVNSVLSARRRSRVNNACTVALEGLAGVQSTDDKGSSRASGYESFLEGEVSLAEFPQAGIISSVVSAEGSEPVHSLLLRQNEMSTACWRAPSGVDMVELTVVLNSLSVVSSIMFMTKLGGYTAKDAPMVDLWSGSLADEGARTYLGRFDVKAEISKPRSPRTLPPEYFRYKLRHAVTCRIIWIKFSLPSSSRSTNSSLVPGPPVVDLLSFDPPAAPAPSGPGLMINTSTDPSGSSTCIHAKRVIIIGQQIPEDLDTRFMSPIDKQSLKAFLDLPPQLSRLRVQVDMERARSGGRILEQSVNPQALNVAGFRLDAFAAVKNIAKYNPSWAEKSLVNRALGGAVDELITNLPTLRIRVSAIQETNQPVFVGDYLLPVARGGTPLYFDFRHPIMARGLIFEILGNISALTDEDPSQTDTEGKEFPLTNSLSLLNRIRIYRYALGSELGKWPQLNAV